MIPIIEEKCTEWDNGVKVFLHGFKSVAKKFHDYWSDCEVPEVDAEIIPFDHFESARLKKSLLERGLKQRLSVVPFKHRIWISIRHTWMTSH